MAEKILLFSITQSNYLEKVKELTGHYDLPIQQFQVLLLIAGEQGIKGKDLRERLNMTGGSLTRHTKTLSLWYDKKTDETKGLNLIQSQQSIENRREFEYYLTEKGHEVIKALFVEFKKNLDTLCKKWGYTTNLNNQKDEDE